MVVVSVEEAKALQRFRNNRDAGFIKAVLLRELGLTREKYESEPADETTRSKIKVYKDVLGILFEEQVVRNG